MMYAPFRLLTVAAALLCAVAFPSTASADIITATVSVVASGTLGTTAFTNSLVTITDTFSSYQLQACFAADPLNCGGPTEGYVHALYTPGVIRINETVTVAGIGIGTGGGGQPGASVYDHTLALGEVAGYFDLNVTSAAIPANYIFGSSLAPFTGTISEPLLGEDCRTVLPDCPVGFDTTLGFLALSSVADTATGQVQVGKAVTPEPGTWILVGTGLVGAAGLVRRRFGR